MDNININTQENSIFTDENIRDYLDKRKKNSNSFSYKLLVTTVSIVFTMVLSNFYILNILQNANNIYSDIIEVKDKSILSLQKLKTSVYSHRKLQWKFFSTTKREEIGATKAEIFEAENKIDFLIKDFDYINAGSEENTSEEISRELSEMLEDYFITSDKIMKLYDSNQKKASIEMLRNDNKIHFDRILKKIDFSSKRIEKEKDEEYQSAKKRSIMARNFVYLVLIVTLIATFVFAVLQLNRKRSII